MNVVCQIDLSKKGEQKKLEREVKYIKYTNKEADVLNKSNRTSVSKLHSFFLSCFDFVVGSCSFITFFICMTCAE